MPSQEQVLEALRAVMDPEIGRNIVDLNMVRNIKIHKNGRVEFELALTIIGCPMKNHMAENARSALMRLEGVKEVEIKFTEMSEEDRKAIFGNRQEQLPKINAFNRIGQVIAVMSGKGGVGKSSITALLATGLVRAGQKVGIMDADITGPSIPKLFGLPAGGLRGSEQGILPAVTDLGVRAMSTNLLVANENDAVIWRGPMIAGVIRQFWTDVLWGKLDTLLIDLPPGTSDAALTVMQTLPVNGVVLVTTPQQLAAMVVRKAMSMLTQLNIPVVSVVENMSYYPCPDNGGKPHYIFGPSHADEIAAEAKAPVAARLPLRPEIAELGDQGKIESILLPELEPAVQQLLERLKK